MVRSGFSLNSFHCFPIQWCTCSKCWTYDFSLTTWHELHGTAMIDGHEKWWKQLEIIVKWEAFAHATMWHILDRDVLNVKNSRPYSGNANREPKEK